MTLVCSSSSFGSGCRRYHGVQCCSQQERFHASSQQERFHASMGAAVCLCLYRHHANATSAQGAQFLISRRSCIQETTSDKLSAPFTRPSSSSNSIAQPGCCVLICSQLPNTTWHFPLPLLLPSVSNPAQCTLALIPAAVSCVCCTPFFPLPHSSPHQTHVHMSAAVL